MIVSGDEINLVGDVHVPVDSFRGSGRRVATTSVDQQADQVRSIFLIAAVVGEYL